MDGQQHRQQQDILRLLVLPYEADNQQPRIQYVLQEQSEPALLLPILVTLVLAHPNRISSII